MAKAMSGAAALPTGKALIALMKRQDITVRNSEIEGFVPQHKPAPIAGKPRGAKRK